MKELVYGFDRVSASELSDSGLLQELVSESGSVGIKPNRDIERYKDLKSEALKRMRGNNNEVELNLTIEIDRKKARLEKLKNERAHFESEYMVTGETIKLEIAMSTSKKIEQEQIIIQDLYNKLENLRRE